MDAEQDLSQTATPIGRWLKAMRSMSGLSLRDVSEASGVNFYKLQQIEEGSQYPSFKHFEAVCTVLKCNPKQYFDDRHSIC